MNLFATRMSRDGTALGEDDRARLAMLPVANVGDAMERMGLVDTAIKPVWSGCRVVGTAHTVWTRAGDNKAIHEALDSVRVGDVIVVSGEADESRALIGDLIAERARLRGVAGFVIDGAVRDADGIREIGMPVFARSLSPAGPYKSGPGAVGAVVAVGGVAVLPGDVVVGDADGVAVIPRARVDEVLRRAEAKAAAEAATRRELAESPADG